MLTFFISTLIPLSIVLIFRLINRGHKPPICGVYQQRNKYYWLKFVCMYVFLSARQFINYLKRLYAVEIGESDDGTIHIHRQDEHLEQMYYLGDYPTSIDAIYFNGMSSEGNGIICGLARRPNNECDAFMMLKINGKELYLTPQLPDTHLLQNSREQGEYKIQGIEIVNFIPMRSWQLSYNGEMKPKSNTENKVTVQLSLTWSAVWVPFNYDLHMSPWSMANDMARELWSRDYFILLKKLHQTHYEQMGLLKGTVVLDGKKHVLNMPCVRDHSFGSYRNWRTFHRYVYHFMFLENGDCMAVGTVCQPAILSHLTIGYLCRKSDQAVFPVDFSDFQLYHHGENQILPKDYGFIFRAGGQSYAVKVKVNEEEVFYIGKERVAKFYERWSTVEVNDIKGWACVEWQYNNIQKNEN